MIKILAAILMVMCLAGGAFAANAVENGEGVITVTLDGSTDFNWATATVTTGIGYGMKVADLYPQGLALSAISVYSGTLNTLIVVRNKKLTGPIIRPKLKVVSGDSLVKYFTGKRLYKPCIEHDDQTTETNAEVSFEFDN